MDNFFWPPPAKSSGFILLDRLPLNLLGLHVLSMGFCLTTALTWRTRNPSRSTDQCLKTYDLFFLFTTANSTHTKTHHMLKDSNHHPEVSNNWLHTGNLRQWMRLQSISLHHYGVQVPFKTTSRLVFAKKSGGFQSGIPDENWWKVTFTIEWLGFRG